MTDRLESARRFIGELSRRRVFRTAALYVIVAVVAIEATEALAGPLDMPLRTLPLLAWAMILGFPIAVGLAWTFDVTPRGIVRTPPDSEEDRRRRSVSARVAFRLTLTGVAAAAVGAVTWVVMEPLIPHVPHDPAVVAEAGVPAGIVVVGPVEEGDGVDPVLAGRAHVLLLQSLSEVASLRPVDPRRVEVLLAGGADLSGAAVEVGAERILGARLETAPGGVRLRAQLRETGDRSSVVEASAAGSADDLEELVRRVVRTLVGPDAVRE